MGENESPYLLLTWLQSGSEDLQLTALEQLCLALLQYDSNEALLKFYPPSTYVPILACLCQDFDISFSLLEAIIRTLTYYMQALPHEVINRLVNSKGTLMAMCMRLEYPNMSNTTVSDLTQQIIKLFEELCKRDTKSLSSIGGTSYIINYMSDFNQIIHLDTIKSGFYVLYKIIDKIDPTDDRLKDWVGFLSKFLDNTDNRIVEYSLHCMLSIIKICNEKNVSTDHLGIENIIDNLLEMTLHQMKFGINQTNDVGESRNETPNHTTALKNGLPKVVIDLILCMIKSSTQFLCNLLIKSKLVDILMEIILQYENASLSIIQLVEGMFEQIVERTNYRSIESLNNYKSITSTGFRITHGRIYSDEMIQQYNKYHNCLMKAIINGSLDVIKELLLSTDFDPKYKDNHGQTPLNWSCALGFTDSVNLLYARGIDPNAGDYATSLHYVVIHGHNNIMDIFIKNQPIDIFAIDNDGKTIIDRIEEYIEQNVNSDNSNYYRELLAKIEKHKSELDVQVINAKQYYIKRIIPVLISIYCKTYKTQIRYHILELLYKVVRSFTKEDHKVFIDEIYENHPLTYHLTILIYRVLLQDSGENVLEAIKLCHLLTKDVEYSTGYIKLFGRMGLNDVLHQTIDKFCALEPNESIMKEDLKIIPLSSDPEFSNNTIQTKNKFSEISLLQSYYWGDWNIMTTEDGLNIFNEYCYTFIPLQSLGSSNDSLTVYIVLRKEIEYIYNDDNSIGTSNPISSGHTSNMIGNVGNRSAQPLFDHFCRHQPWKTYIDNSSNDVDACMTEPSAFRDTCNSDSDYSIILIYDRKVTCGKEQFQFLMEKYTHLMMFWKPYSLSIPFPKFSSSKILNYKNLELCSISSHLKVYLKSELDLDNNQTNSDSKEIPDPEFVEISINKIYGVTVKTVNQLIYKTGSFNKQAGIKKLGLSKSVADVINCKLNKSVNPLRQNVCKRIKENGTALINLIDTYPIEPLNFINSNYVVTSDNIGELLTEIEKLFSCHLNRPTPIELYKSDFIQIFSFLAMNHADLVLIQLGHCLPVIIKCLVQLLELIENLPTNFQLHSVIGEHYLTRSLHMKVTLANCQESKSEDVDPIPDLSKYNFLVMPLASPIEIKNRFVYLLNRLPWYRANKFNLNCFRQLRHPPYFKELPYIDSTTIMGSNGLFHWLSTNGFKTKKSMNPMKLELVSVILSDNTSTLLCTNSSLYNLFNYRTAEIMNSRTSNKVIGNSDTYQSQHQHQHQYHHQNVPLMKNYVSVMGNNCFLTILLHYPLGCIPTHYCLARPLIKDSDLYCLTNWKLWASYNGIDWDLLKVHERDYSLLESRTVGYCVWPIDLSDELKLKVQNHGWNHFKIQQISEEECSQQMVPENLYNEQQPMSSQQFPISSKGFWLNSVEFYGSILTFSEEKQKEIKRNIDKYLERFKIGTFVKPSSDWSFNDVDNFKLGKVISGIKNGTVLVEWTKDDEKCNLRNKMGLHGRYELIILSSPEQIVEQEESQCKNLTESFVESRSSFDNHPESKEDRRISCHESFSWIVDPNFSTPLRTSSLSSQRNSRLPSFSNKDNVMDVNMGIYSKDNYLRNSRKNRPESVEDFPDQNILIKSETDDIDMHDEENENSGENDNEYEYDEDEGEVDGEADIDIDGNIDDTVESIIPSAAANITPELTGKSSKSIIHVKNDEELQDAKINNQNIKQQKEESKKNFSLSKQPKRKNCHILDILTESRKDPKIKDNVHFNTNTENMENSDDSDDYESSRAPHKFLKKSTRIVDDTEITKIKPFMERKSYNGLGKGQKYKQSYVYGMTDNNRFKPINIDHSFPGLVQSLDQRSGNFVSMNPTQVRSNIETINYKNGRGLSPVQNPNNKLKKFGFDWKYFNIKLEIHKPIIPRIPLPLPRLMDADMSGIDFDDFSRIEEFITGTQNMRRNKKFSFTFDENSSFPIINCILNTLPQPDPILNFYPIDNVSESWHCNFTINYGFCEKPINNKSKKSCSENCLYKLTNDDTTVKPIQFPTIHDSGSCNSTNCILELLKLLYKVSKIDQNNLNIPDEINDNPVINDSEFISHHLCKKTLTQLEDVWSLLSRQTLPTWLTQWPRLYPFLYSFDIRVNILRGYWFGISRSIHWLQHRIKPTPEYVRPTFRDDLPTPFHFLGRLKKHVAKIPRPYTYENWGSKSNDPELLKSRSKFWTAVSELLLFHAESKEELEIQFEGEEGTGLGPTLEFVSLLSTEFQRITTKMWVHSDDAITLTGSFDSEEEEEFVSGGREAGLFPCPWPADEITSDILDRFTILGILMAKCLQDNRRIDIPFSKTFLKILISEKYLYLNNYNEYEYLNDFISIYPERGEFLKSVSKFCQQKQDLISSSNTLNDLQQQLQHLATNIIGTSFDQLCIDMEFLSLSKHYSSTSYPLLDQYSWEDNYDATNDFCNALSTHESVNEYNSEKYLKRTLLYALNKGIKKQIEAIRAGFNQVFPIESLQMFSPSELNQLLCGEQHIIWSLDELYQYTEPLQGYNTASPTYRNLLEVLVQMSQPDRKLFVRFITGCTNLPPGGLRNLRPRLTIVKKAIRDGGPYPSVNTCMHYLKLPEYDTKAQLKSHLMEACKQVGFYLN